MARGKVEYIMNNFKIKENLTKNILPDGAFPELAVVKKVYKGGDKGKYCIDCEVVIPGGLELTGEIIPEVPINPIWVNKEQVGIYSLPALNDFVIIGFIKGLRSFPFVLGYYSDKYQTPELQEKELLITDGKNIEFKISLNDNKITFKNSNSELVISNNEILLGGDNATQKAILGDSCKISLDTLITLLKTHTHSVVVGGPGTYETAPSGSLSGLQNPVENALSNLVKLR